MRKFLTTLMFLLVPIGPVQALCTGDCGADGSVTVDEIVLGVSIALGTGHVSQCSDFDADRNGEVTIDEVIGAVNNALLGCVVGTPTPTATPRPTVTPTPAAVTGPQLPNPRPAPAQGCGGGYGVAALSNGSPGNNSHVGFASPANLAKVQGSLAAITPTLFSFGGSAVNCPSALGQTARLFTFTIGGAQQEPVPGSTYALRPTYNFTGSPTVAQVDYLEQIPTQPFAGRGWRAQSGTLTVEAIDATSMRVRISAEMAAEKNVFPVGTEAPVGTFHLEAVIAVDAFVRQ